MITAIKNLQIESHDWLVDNKPTRRKKSHFWRPKICGLFSRNAFSNFGKAVNGGPFLRNVLHRASNINKPKI